MDRVVIKKKIQKEVEEYLIKAFQTIDNSYEKGNINPNYFADIIYLSSIAIKLEIDKEKWEEIGFNLCYELKRCIEIYKIHRGNTAMISGFGYICFAVKCYAEATGRLDKFSQSLHALLVDEAAQKPVFNRYTWRDTKSGDFDCISGAAGLLLYLLSCEDKINHSIYADTINKVSDYLINLTGKHIYLDQEVYNFHIPSTMLYLDEEKRKFPNGNFNFGMAHGMIGPLVALSSAYYRGHNRPHLLASIKKLFEFYKDFSVEIEENIYWPGQLPYEDLKKILLVMNPFIMHLVGVTVMWAFYPV